jgi:hypothetical protein
MRRRPPQAVVGRWPSAPSPLCGRTMARSPRPDQQILRRARPSPDVVALQLEMTLRHAQALFVAGPIDAPLAGAFHPMGGKHG